MAKTQTDKTTVSSVGNAYDSKRFDSENPKGIETTYEFVEYENLEEAKKNFSESDLLELVNARVKGNARSAAIAKVTNPYKLDANDPVVVRARMIKDAMKSNPKLDEAKATKLVDSLIGAGQ